MGDLLDFDPSPAALPPLLEAPFQRIRAAVKGLCVPTMKAERKVATDGTYACMLGEGQVRVTSNCWDAT